MKTEASMVGIDQEKKDLKLGTPQTLNQAIRYGMMIGPMAKMDESIESFVKDYVAQKFQAAILKTASHPNKETGAQIESTLVRLYETLAK